MTRGIVAVALILQRCPRFAVSPHFSEALPMKTRLLTAALAVTFAFSACQPNAAGGGNTAGGSVAVSKDDALV